ncbi:MAG: hypothetical protein DRN61_02055 [Thaumarchaeota archaeon]|nr:MAG: hypothetical protein DRN61_02055 [Nitrososphaerota archaeon]
MTEVLEGRIIWKGRAEGEALATSQPISFYGGVDPETGRIIERGHELEGEIIADKILVFPHGKGSTVGSYILLRLKRRGLAPRAIINRRCEPIIAVGAIIAEIPCVDKVDVSKISTGDQVIIEGGRIEVRKRVTETSD